MKTAVIVFYLFSFSAFGRGIKDEVEFVIKSQHLDFSAPKSCTLRVEASGKILSSSYGLKESSCNLDESELTKKDPALSKKVDIFVCAMLVPALNTSGRDFFKSCSRKKTEGDVLTFSKCGPKKNIVTELNVNQLTVRSNFGESTGEFTQDKYELLGDKIYPIAMELKSAVYHQKITKIEYDGSMPRSVLAEENGNNLKISFLNCVKNH